MKYALIGSGKLATHFKHYFKLLGLEQQIKQWSRQDQRGNALSTLIEECDLFILAISDDSIDSFIESHPLLKGKKLYHLSGAHRSPFALGVHPLSTFGHQLYTLSDYKVIPFIGEVEEKLFHGDFPNLPNPYYYLNPEKKALYHALCVLAGNGSFLLWQKAMLGFRELGLPSECLHPYLQQTVANLTSFDPVLTGPMARRDHQTILKNISALNGDPYQDVYLDLLKAVDVQLFHSVEKSFGKEKQC